MNDGDQDDGDGVEADPAAVRLMLRRQLAALGVFTRDPLRDPKRPKPKTQLPERFRKWQLHQKND